MTALSIFYERLNQGLTFKMHYKNIGKNFYANEKEIYFFIFLCKTDVLAVAPDNGKV